MLAMDTATTQVGVAVGRDGRVLGELRIDGGRRHAEELVPAIAALATQTGITLDAVVAIAVGTGPGLYTGLRVGVTTARTLAQVLDVPVVGIPSLDLVAYPWRMTNRQVVALVDARRKEVFAARYWPVPGGIQRDGDYTVESPDAVAAALEASGVESLLVGDGALEHAGASRASTTWSTPAPRARHPASARSSSSPRPGSSARSSAGSTRSHRCTCAGVTPRSRGTCGERRGRTRDDHRRAAAPEASPRGDGDRAAGLLAPVDAFAVPVRARAPGVARVPRGAGRSRRGRLRRA